MPCNNIRVTSSTFISFLIILLYVVRLFYFGIYIRLRIGACYLINFKCIILPVFIHFVYKFEFLLWFFCLCYCALMVLFVFYTLNVNFFFSLIYIRLNCSLGLKCEYLLCTLCFIQICVNIVIKDIWSKPLVLSYRPVIVTAMNLYVDLRIFFFLRSILYVYFHYCYFILWCPVLNRLISHGF